MNFHDITPLFDKGIGSVVSNTSVGDDVVRARRPFEDDQIALHDPSGKYSGKTISCFLAPGHTTNWRKKFHHLVSPP